jgi:hypothetical protein
MNREREAKLKQKWELKNGMACLEFRNQSGPKPKWKFQAKTGRLSRKFKGGVDWYRYQKVIEIFYINFMTKLTRSVGGTCSKLLPFVREC